MAVVGATKENRKGSSQSYNNRRKLLLYVLAVSSFFLVSWHIRRTILLYLFDGHNFGTIAKQPLRRIDYGTNGPNSKQLTPVVMIQTSMEKQLHNRFLEEYLYSCTEEELNAIPELDNRVKKPVYVYEGYYHSLPTSGKIFSKNPNPLIGKDFMKPAASPFTRAFFDTFRHVNREIFNKLKDELLKASSFHPPDPDTDRTLSNDASTEDVCYIFAKWIEKGFHFGDLSIQIHYGKGNEEKLSSGAAWHNDAENSLLHFAITLRGHRVLHSKRIWGDMNNSTEGGLRGPPSESIHNVLQMSGDKVLTEIRESQNPGDVYLSSSTLMSHAPQFFDTDFTTRVIAIHARILYTNEDINHFRSVRTKESWEKLTNVIANTLSLSDLRIPSLRQVESRLALLS